ncbi:MAG: hypothetical protein ACKO4N_07885 [Verrucomicrobiota bacterium]
MRALLTSFACLLAALLGAQQDVVSWEVTPPVCGPGQPFRLQVRIESSTPLGPAERIGKDLRAPDGMALRFSGQIFRAGSNEALLNFSGVAPERAADHVIPDFLARFSGKVFTVSGVTVRVREGTGFRKEGVARAELELPDRSFFVGERIRGAVLLRGSETEPVTGAFGLETSAEGFSFAVTSDDEDLPDGLGRAIRFELTPIRPGPAEFNVGGIMLVQPGGFGAFSAAGRDRPFTFSRKIRVERVPQEGRPADWGGAVGRFTAEAVQISNLTPEVGEPIQFRALLSGEGNLDRIVPPELRGGEQWDVLPAPERRRRADTQRAFTWRLVPRLPGQLMTPAVRISVFDPETRKFSEAVFSPQEVNVTGEAPAKVELTPTARGADPAAPGAVTGLLAPSAGSRSLRPSVLQDIASADGFWRTNSAFAALALAGSAFVGVAAFLTRNPRFIPRARARRAAAMALGAAAAARRRGDWDAFARAAVRGLRAGCAYLLEAEPEALTAGDVLRAIPEARAEPVARTFLRADGVKFGASDLPSLEADADAVQSLLSELTRIR